MTTISELGQRLLNSIQRVSPTFLEGFNPGILHDQIDHTLGSLNYILPNDFYDLYKWRNGNQNYFNQPVEAIISQFSSIEFVSEDKNWENWGDEVPTYKKLSLLPFIEEDSRYFSIVIGRSYEDEAYIVHVGREGETTLRYDSIKSMLTSTVRCFEENAFYIKEDGVLGENITLSRDILRSENPQTLIETMLDIRNCTGIYGLDNESSESIYSNRVAPLISALGTLEYFRGVEAIEVVQSALSKLRDKSSDRAHSAKYTLNRWLNDVGAPQI